ncbi:Uncharacterised protein [Cedecea lapagei]|uniref:Uncharacterized protein n=1 Tax=Cedecea lapagei TaxID=158823 RepID=A0A3S4KU23_9ENTR|nr:hypothetical protein [Cedecea lapagei]VEB97386.1 Uncharacterised protein [Cedecea lapagei]VEC00267.1 Uncharacterised protein [Cedecea lapagei]
MSNIELMQHALGISERNREPYRNYFLASGDHPDNKAWQQLVGAGMAYASPAPAWSCGDVIYQVTDAGKAVAIAALPEPKKRTRYGEYLHADYGHSFAEWLGIELPVYEDREVDRYKWEYRMVRRSRCYWDSYYDICGEWKPTKKAAKASYKEALKKRREAK